MPIITQSAESYSSIEREHKRIGCHERDWIRHRLFFCSQKGHLLKPGQYTRNEPILAFVRECMASRRNAVDTTALQRAIADWRQVFGPRGCAAES